MRIGRCVRSATGYAAAMHEGGQRLRAVANWMNLSTPLGLVAARLGRASVRRGPHRLWIAEGYSLPFPAAGAFTVGSVVLICRGNLDDLESRFPDILEHERAHSRQWAATLGLPFLPLYAAGALWSNLRTGTPHGANPFEVNANLAKGGYREASKRPLPRLRRLSGR